MKTFTHTLQLVATLLVFLASTSMRGANYYIFNIEGSVERLVGSQWVKPAKNDGVTVKDKFSLKEGAMLAICDKDTRRVYITREMGVQNVAQIISNARRQSSQTTQLTLQQTMKSANGKAGGATIMGVSYRSSMQEKDMVNDTDMKVYAALQKQLNEPQKSKKPTLHLSMATEDELCYFHIENFTDNLLFFNIIALPDNGESPYLCLDTSSPSSENIATLSPHATTTLYQYPFASTDTPCQYLLFASEQPFDSEVIGTLLEQQHATKGVKPLPLLFQMME
ncbi:MAG: hypothetical protein IKQ62_07740 [Bacteroidaceae bacterium]|nr:hypothetical protein [Bacteroidaceae bacterium]